MDSISRFFAAASLIALLAACGGEGAREREEDPSDREKPSLAAPQADKDREDNKEGKEEKDEADD